MRKYSTANKVIEDMAKFNKIEVPKEFIIEESANIENGSGKQKTSQEVGMASLLTSKPLRGRLIVMAFNWIVATLCYYGLSLNAGIGSDVFSAFSLSAFMEIPAYCFSAMVSCARKLETLNCRSRDNWSDHLNVRSFQLRLTPLASSVVTTHAIYGLLMNSTIISSTTVLLA